MPAVTTMPIVAAVIVLLVMVSVHLVRGVLMARVHRVALDVVVRQRIRGPRFPCRALRHARVVLVGVFFMHPMLVMPVLMLRHNACLSMGVLMLVTHDRIRLLYPRGVKFFSPSIVLIDATPSSYAPEDPMSRFTRPSTRQVIVRAALVGFAAGLRSMTPLGILAAERNDASLQGGWKNWPVLSSPTGRVLLQVSTVGEMVVDKLPFVPSRTAPGPLGGRMVIGALSGAAIGTLAKDPAAKASALAIGMLGGLAGAYGGYAYRTKVTEMTGLPDLPVALVEDAAAVLIARKGVRGETS